MSAEEHVEPAGLSTESAAPRFASEAPPRGYEPGATPSVPAAVTAWLRARLDAERGPLDVHFAVTSGRWVLRVERGACASMLEQPVRAELLAGDAVSALRAWAREAGLLAGCEALRASEWRLLLAPPPRS